MIACYVDIHLGPLVSKCGPGTEPLAMMLAMKSGGQNSRLATPGKLCAGSNPEFPVPGQRSTGQKRGEAKGGAPVGVSQILVLASGQRNFPNRRSGADWAQNLLVGIVHHYFVLPITAPTLY